MPLSLLWGWLKRSGAGSPQILPTPSGSVGAEAQFRSGRQCASGEGVVQDFTQAAKWFAQAAEQDYGPAQYSLAMLYGQGQGVARDAAKSLMWLTRAAHLGNAEAQYTLGVRQHLDCRGDQTQAASEGRIEAFKWVRLSAIQGCHGAEHAAEFVTSCMTPEEVAEGVRRAAAFVPQGESRLNLL